MGLWGNGEIYRCYRRFVPGRTHFRRQCPARQLSGWHQRRSAQVSTFVAGTESVRARLVRCHTRSSTGQR
jgi:hypothetical protein